MVTGTRQVQHQSAPYPVISSISQYTTPPRWLQVLHTLPQRPGRAGAGSQGHKTADAALSQGRPQGLSKQAADAPRQQPQGGHHCGHVQHAGGQHRQRAQPRHRHGLPPRPPHTRQLRRESGSHLEAGEGATLHYTPSHSGYDQSPHPLPLTSPLPPPSPPSSRVPSSTHWPKQCWLTATMRC